MPPRPQSEEVAKEKAELGEATGLITQQAQKAQISGNGRKIVRDPTTIKAEQGWLGIFFGSPDHAPFNIAGLIAVVLLILIGVSFGMPFEHRTEVLKYLVPILTSIIGFLIGKAKSSR